MANWEPQNYRIEGGDPDHLVEKIKDVLHGAKGSQALKAVLDILDMEILRLHGELMVLKPGDDSATATQYQMQAMNWLRHKLTGFINARGDEEEARLRLKAQNEKQFMDRQFFDGSALTGGMSNDIFGMG